MPIPRHQVLVPRRIVHVRSKPPPLTTEQIGILQQAEGRGFVDRAVHLGKPSRVHSLPVLDHVAQGVWLPPLAEVDGLSHTLLREAEMAKPSEDITVMLAATAPHRVHPALLIVEQGVVPNHAVVPAALARG